MQGKRGKHMTPHGACRGPPGPPEVPMRLLTLRRPTDGITADVKAVAFRMTSKLRRNVPRCASHGIQLQHKKVGLNLTRAAP